MADVDAALQQLGARVRQELELNGQPDLQWVPPTAGVDHEVLILGGGQAGLAAAFALQRARIPRVLVVDKAPRGQEGCWRSYARMHTLRSPKHMHTIELDVPSLSPRAWFEAKYGEEAWEAITFIPREDWADYLDWYREVLRLPVRSETEAVAVRPPAEPDGPFEVDLRSGGAIETTTARRVVFALGLEGAGGLNVPPFVRNLPAELWAHSAHSIDFGALAGKKVAVLGAGASGWDNAACALEAGAQVTLFARREAIATSNPLRWMEFAGFQNHYADFTDAQKFAFTSLSGGLPQPPTQLGVWRALDHEAFELSLGSPFESVDVVDGPAGKQLRITTPNGVATVDFLISCTGYVTDLGLRPELSEFVDQISLWADAHEPAAGTALGACPYLGGGFEFTAKDAEAAPWMTRLYHLSTGARVSMGVAGHQLSGIAAGQSRLAASVSRGAFTEHADEFIADFRAHQHTEIHSLAPHTPDEGWRPTGPAHSAETAR